MFINIAWSKNAKLVEEVYGTYVDYEEKFYICPECGEPVYAVDWTEPDELPLMICPICGFRDESQEAAAKEYWSGKEDYEDCEDNESEEWD